ncbi:MAG: phospho-N-acetylmuramoyl-pentapeptide-transferase, partial [Flavobacteriales bacterium]|nr:phospho-N-acetylmuramoyl-pentapeptide-transferase [Flavobacteriales bacterium]
MLYYLFQYLDSIDIPGTGVFAYISFRAAGAIITSLIISMLFGKGIIRWLQRHQFGEVVRDLGLEGQLQKQGTPTMGGLIILTSILVPTLLFAQLHNIYILLMIGCTIGLGAIGFLDDYLKIKRKNKDGLAGKFKVVGQVGIGLAVGLVLYFNDDVVVKHKVYDPNAAAVSTSRMIDPITAESRVYPYRWEETKDLKTTIPFVKNNEFDYAWLLTWLGSHMATWAWLVFIPAVILIVTAVSNGANITDGLDGLATGTSAIIGTTLAALAYVSGNYLFADYLNIMFIPQSGELVVFSAAFVGACIGFLWYNSYPAQVFMGDTGSLAIGGIIAVFAIAIRKELLIPVLCGIFLIENMSVVLQVAWFKYTKRKYGEGRRIFL